jgi:Bacterial PH domain
MANNNDDMNRKNSIVFPSKRDWWLMLILVGAMVIEVFVGISILWLGKETWVGVVMLLAGALIGWLITTNYYVVNETDLLIHCGPLWWKVPLHAIESITPTWNLLSSPALSLDRLWISYSIGNKKRAIMISPREKEWFFLVILTKVPGLKRDENKLIRG